jgi:hypothetical protein
VPQLTRLETRSCAYMAALSWFGSDEGGRENTRGFCDVVWVFCWVGE